MESPSELVQACRELEQACRTLVRVLFQPFERPIRWMLDRMETASEVIKRIMLGDDTP